MNKEVVGPPSVKLGQNLHARKLQRKGSPCGDGEVGVLSVQRGEGQRSRELGFLGNAPPVPNSRCFLCVMARGGRLRSANRPPACILLRPRPRANGQMTQAPEILYIVTTCSLRHRRHRGLILAATLLIDPELGRFAISRSCDLPRPFLLTPQRSRKRLQPPTAADSILAKKRLTSTHLLLQTDPPAPHHRLDTPGSE
jgi:hypothetical protein